MMHYGSNTEEEVDINSAKTVATWSGNIAAPATVRITHWNGDNENPVEVNWFTINLTSSNNGGGGGDNGGNGDME